MPVDFDREAFDRYVKLRAHADRADGNENERAAFAAKAAKMEEIHADFRRIYEAASQERAHRASARERVEEHLNVKIPTPDVRSWVGRIAERLINAAIESIDKTLADEAAELQARIDAEAGRFVDEAVRDFVNPRRKGGPMPKQPKQPPPPKKPEDIDVDELIDELNESGRIEVAESEDELNGEPLYIVEIEVTRAELDALKEDPAPFFDAVIQAVEDDEEDDDDDDEEGDEDEGD